MLKPTKHATTNFKMLVPFLDEVDRCGGSITMTREGLMPLSIEDLGYTFEGRKVYGMMHFYTQAGDMMRDPDMTFAVDREKGTVEPLTYQQDNMACTRRSTPRTASDTSPSSAPIWITSCGSG